MNESKFMNPVLIAQQYCRDAMFHVAEYMDLFLKELKKNEYIVGYDVNVEPFKNGYEMTIRTQLNYGKMVDLKTAGQHDELKILNALNLKRIYFLPGSSFNESFDEKRSKLEWDVFNHDGESDRRESITPSIDEIIEFAQFYKDRNIHAISQWYNNFFV